MNVNWNRAATIALGVLGGTIAAAGTLGVTAGGFALSFDAITAVATAAHVRPDLAWLMPVTIDGPMAIATVVALILHRLGRSPLYPWLVVLAGTGVSIVCNALHASMGGRLELDPRAAMLVSAIPAVMLALSVHLLVVLVEAIRDHLAAHRPEPEAGPEPQPEPAPAPKPDPAPKPGRKPPAAKAGQSGVGAVAAMRAEYDRIVKAGGTPEPKDLRRAAKDATGKDPGGATPTRYLAKWVAAQTDLDAEAAKLAQSGRTDG